jgi:PGF-pre-PGF domain-containing protein/uncharacterized repeat protein (TIGR01451 family)
MQKFPFTCWILLILALGITPAFAAHYAYIPNYNDNNVSVLDLSSYTLVRNISVGTQPYGVAVHPAATFVYVTNRGSDTVSVIDTASDTVTATISVGSGPRGIAVNPAGTRLYVANYGASSVSVVDIASLSVISTIAGVGSSPVGIAVSPDGTRVYAPSRFGKFTVIDATANTILTSYALGGNGFGLAVNASGLGIYVASNYADNLSVIDGTSSTFVRNISVGAYPIAVAVDPRDTRVYVANFNSYTVSVIDQATGSVTGTVNVGREPQGIAINGSGSRLLVPNSADNNVTVIDTTTNTVVTNITVGRLPVGQGTFILPERADLGLTITASPNPVTTGGSLTYTLTAGTAGPDSGMNVWVNDTLPEGITFVSATPAQGSCSHSGSSVNCSLGTVTCPGTVAISLVVTAPSSAGTLTNNARITSTTYDPSATNTTATISTTVQAPESSTQTGSSGGTGSTGSTAASTLSRLTAGEEAYFPFRNPDLPVRSVTLTSETDTGQVLITAVERSLPAGTPPPGVPVYQYVDLRAYHIPEGCNIHAAIEFRLPRSWLTGQKARSHQVVLLRNVLRTWNELPIEFLKEEEGTLYYRASTPGFSLFAIGANMSREAPSPAEPTVATTTAVPAVTKATLPPSEPSPPDSTTLPLESIPTTPVPPGPETSAPISPSLPPLIAIAAVVVLAVGILIWRRPRIHTIRRKR